MFSTQIIFTTYSPSLAEESVDGMELLPQFRPYVVVDLESVSLSQHLSVDFFDICRSQIVVGRKTKRSERRYGRKLPFRCSDDGTLFISKLDIHRAHLL